MLRLAMLGDIVSTAPPQKYRLHTIRTKIWGTNSEEPVAGNDGVRSTAPEPQSILIIPWLEEAW
jgi:hypothetical protein